MSQQFGYQSIKTMDPRPGVNYATRYYRQNPTERARLLGFVNSVLQDLAERIERTPELADALAEPLRDFRKSNRSEFYTAIEIITDLGDQLREGRDAPESMIGRWNRLFADRCDMQIQMMTHADLPDPERPSNRFAQLFSR